MSSRPALRVLKNVARITPHRQLHITDPASLHETSSTADISDAPRRATINAMGVESIEGGGSMSTRKFGTTTRLSAWRDASTIDFAYLPVALDPDSSTDNPIRVPLLLETMYHGVQARAMHEDDTEATLKPLINLISADSTHISSPSPMSEVHDNNSVSFEGIQLRVTEAAKAVEEEANELKGTVKQFFRELLK